MNAPANLVLVLPGGNALGAYQAGAFEMLAQRGLGPGRIAATSIGAINAAIIAGNAPEQRLERLRAFWERAEQLGTGDVWGMGQAPPSSSSWEKRAAGLQTLLAGRPGLFRPHLFGFWSALLAHSDEPSLLDTRPTLETLRELVDFDRLNGGDVRLTILAVDAETGEDVEFDTQHARIGPEHICASASFPVLFQPVEIDGRWLVDGGMSANLPLRLALSEPPLRDTLCVALDLVSRKGEHPRSVGAAAERMQDLIFATQSRQAILSLQREYRFRRMAAGQEPGGGAAMRLLYLAYGGSEGATALKALDFTAGSIRSRWAAGKTDMEAALEQLGTLPRPDPGLMSAFELEAGVLTEVKAEFH